MLCIDLAADVAHDLDGHSWWCESPADGADDRDGMTRNCLFKQP
jgi:hypothetical protein